MRNLLRHPLSLVGAGLVILSGVSIIFLFLIEAITGRSNPYLGIFTYMVYPALLLAGGHHRSAGGVSWNGGGAPKAAICRATR